MLYAIVLMSDDNHTLTDLDRIVNASNVVPAEVPFLKFPHVHFVMYDGTSKALSTHLGLARRKIPAIVFEITRNSYAGYGPAVFDTWIRKNSEEIR